MCRAPTRPKRAVRRPNEGSQQPRTADPLKFNDWIHRTLRGAPYGIARADGGPVGRFLGRRAHIVLLQTKGWQPQQPLFLIAVTATLGISSLGRFALSRMLSRDAMLTAELWSRTELRGGLEEAAAALSRETQGAVRRKARDCTNRSHCPGSPTARCSPSGSRRSAP
jgi:hypothetical protein